MARSAESAESRGRTMLHRGGPFSLPHWLYRLGFDWQEEMELQPGWTTATWDIPAWAGSPQANVIGTWKTFRKRLTYLGVPIMPWLEVCAR